MTNKTIKNVPQASNKVPEYEYSNQLIETALTYWRNCDKEYDGTNYSQGLTYRASNTVLSDDCELDLNSPVSLFEKHGVKNYKSIDCSTFVGLVLRYIGYEEGPYGSQENFKEFRKGFTTAEMVLPSVKHGFTPGRSASSIGQYFCDPETSQFYSAIDLKTIGTAKDDYSGLKKGDLIFWSKKDSKGNYVVQGKDRWKNISHVGIVYGKSSSNGGLSVIECTSKTAKKHQWTEKGVTKTCDAGIVMRRLVGNDDEYITYVARLKPKYIMG